MEKARVDLDSTCPQRRVVRYRPAVSVRCYAQRSGAFMERGVPLLPHW